mmetsp:Transcript_59747/g.173099  ORF Transcript_59747/g.173099 Transcript_59747/m.173099 type:complete len:86 (-) Transcript_59747:286-543(-)
MIWIQSGLSCDLQCLQKASAEFSKKISLLDKVDDIGDSIQKLDGKCVSTSFQDPHAPGVFCCYHLVGIAVGCGEVAFESRHRQQG